MITTDEHRELTVGLKAEVAKNWLLNDGRSLEDGRWEYRGQAMDNIEDAQLLAYADVKNVEDTGRHLTSAQLQKAALDIAMGAYKLWIGDDINTLLDPEANLLEKTWSGISLASNFIPGAAIGKLGLKTITAFRRLRGITKASGKIPANIARSPRALRQLQQKMKLTDAQIAAFKKDPTKFRNGRFEHIEVYKGPKDTAIFRTKIKSNIADGSHTVREYLVDKNGKLLFQAHKTQLRNGSFRHWRIDQEGPFSELFQKAARRGQKVKPQIDGPFEDEYYNTWQQILDKVGE